MHSEKNLSWGRIAATLASLAVVTPAAAAQSPGIVGAVEVPHATELGDEKNDDKKKGDEKTGDKKGNDKRAEKKKKTKKDGSCGAKGGCGAGSCG